MKRLQYWTEVDPEYTQEAADAIEQLDAEAYAGPTEEEIVECLGRIEKVFTYLQLTPEQCGAMLAAFDRGKK